MNNRSDHFTYLKERHDMGPDVVVELDKRERGVERDGLGAMALVPAYVDVAVLDAEQESRAKSASGGGGSVAANRALVAVDAGGEGGVVARGEGVGGVGEEGGDRGGAIVKGGPLQGSAAEAIGCAQRQRVLADQELENGGVAVALRRVMKGRVPNAVGDGHQAPLPRVELGRSDHQLIEFQWRQVAAGVHDGSGAKVLVEELIDRVAVSEGLDMGDGHLPLLICHEFVQGTRRPAGAARVSVRSGEGESEERRGVCLSLV